MTLITPSGGFDFPRAVQPDRPALRAFQPVSPSAALGLAVSHLMTKPAFAQLRFGTWSRVLVGQVNRGHYRFVLDDTERIAGFLGWVVTDEATAEAWLHGRDGLAATPRAQAKAEADCIVFNAWTAKSPAVNRFVLNLAREAMLGLRLLYFKRSYDTGAVRPGRMRVNDFVERKAGVAH